MHDSPIEIPAERVDRDSVVLKRVAARGRFVGEHTIYLDNKLRLGRPGYEVVTPLRLDGMHVLVNRGWVPAAATRESLPDVPTPRGEVRVEGLALAHLPQVLVLGKARGKVRPSLDLESFQAETGLRLQPIVIEQHTSTADGLVRDWPRSDAGAAKNESYALQWYSLAGLAVILLIVLSFRRVAAR